MVNVNMLLTMLTVAAAVVAAVALALTFRNKKALDDQTSDIKSDVVSTQGDVSALKGTLRRQLAGVSKDLGSLEEGEEDLKITHVFDPNNIRSDLHTHKIKSIYLGGSTTKDRVVNALALAKCTPGCKSVSIYFESKNTIIVLWNTWEQGSKWATHGGTSISNQNKELNGMYHLLSVNDCNNKQNLPPFIKKLLSL